MADRRMKIEHSVNGAYVGRHREASRRVTPSVDGSGSFWVDAPERVTRGVGDRQVGGRDD